MYAQKRTLEKLLQRKHTNFSKAAHGWPFILLNPDSCLRRNDGKSVNDEKSMSNDRYCAIIKPAVIPAQAGIFDGRHPRQQEPKLAICTTYGCSVAPQN